MPKSVLLVGQGSHLARAVLQAAADQTGVEALLIRGVPHTVDWKTLDLARFDAVVNMAYDPLYMREAYEESRDFDLLVARRAAEAKIHYVMLSTRRVYGDVTSGRPIREDHPTSPLDHYGKNKLHTEKAVQELLEARTTVLRIANVFDFEPGRHTFFGIALRNLKAHDRITLDVSPFTKRDFIHVKDFARLLLKLLAVCPAGVFNLGSGCSTEVGQIALWLIEGYGQGELQVVSPLEQDGFELDRSKLASALGSLGPPADTRRQCLEIGARLSRTQ